MKMSEEKRTAYFTLGQEHSHVINGIYLDKDCVIKITSENPRKKMFELFGKKWAFAYPDNPGREYPKLFPRGVFDLSEVEIEEPVVTDEEILTEMKRYGGSFVSSLADLYRKGDLINRGKIKLAFSNYWNEYKELAVAKKQHVEGK